jgi:hypothetical protein
MLVSSYQFLRLEGWLIARLVSCANAKLERFVHQNSLRIYIFSSSVSIRERYQLR